MLRLMPHPTLALVFWCLWLKDIFLRLSLLFSSSANYLSSGAFSLEGFSLGISPLYSSKVSREIEIFHLLDYASTLKLLPGNVNARRNFLETVSELKLCRRVGLALGKLSRTPMLAGGSS